MPSQPYGQHGGRPALLDTGTVIGFAVSATFIGTAIVLGGRALSFFDLSSFLIVVGGTVGATFVNFPSAEVLRAFDTARTAFFTAEQSGIHRIRQMTELATRARADGVLALEQTLALSEDPFLRKGLQLVVDGLPADDVRHTLEIEMAHVADRHQRGAQLFNSMAAVAPAMGLIGTLIGLVQMLQNLNDPSTIGPGMAVALLTTFYGAMLAYVVFMPIAGKLQLRSDEELLIKQLTVEGLAGIAEQANPRIIEQRLFGFIAPDQRYSRYE